MAAPPSEGSEGPMQRTTMEYIINHVVLPPNLPQKNDYSPTDERLLLHHVIEAFKLFRTILQNNEVNATESVALEHAFAMLNNLASICNVEETLSFINEKALQDSVIQLRKHSAPIPIYVRTQNAGIIISSAVNGVDDNIYFELFELSPLNEAVMSAKGRLRRSFPGCAIAVPREEFQRPAFVSTITDALAKMSDQPAYGTATMIKKSGQMHQEDRDTTHPKMVTELLAAYLRSMGKMAKVSSILKNTRQDVIWKDARSPWHRSALWLLVRVALQLFFSRQKNELAESDTYKNFMLLFTGYILQKAEKCRISSDLIWTIKAKLTRRYLKLGNFGRPEVLQFVAGVLSSAEADLQQRWSQIQANDAILHNFSDLKGLPAAQDTLIHLEELDKYLEAMTKREFSVQSSESHLSCPMPDFTSSLSRSFSEFPSETPTAFKLLKFESWVESNLDAWVADNLSSEQTCQDLSFVLQSYHKCAKAEYQHNPEALSTMFLTIMRLWVALDKSAIGWCDLLGDYRPYWLEGTLQSLILPKKCQMAELQSIEQYLSHRSSRGKFPWEYVFRIYGHPESFVVRYFNQSEEHQNMLSEIEKHARITKKEKCEELATKLDDYRQHMAQYNRMECEYIDLIDRRTGAHETKHSYRCARCVHKKAMNSLTIRLHEWPLPEDKFQAKAVVFELLVPPVFGYWRDSTYFLLTSVLRFKYDARITAPKKFGTGNVKGLLGYFKAYGVPRKISLLSLKKPHSLTHRDVKSVITSPIEEICVKSGVEFDYYDGAKKCLVKSLTPTSFLARACTFRLSVTSKQLQQFLDGTVKHTQFANTAIATQSACPQSLSLEEYKGMATLLDGSKIRWQNHLKELTSPSVDFGKEDTALITLQSIQQAGKADTRCILRETHSILGDKRFAEALLSSLSDACERISRNWQSAPALSVFISIASRVLSLSPAPSIQQLCLKILSRAREISIGWVDILRRKVQQATEDRMRDDFACKSVFVALICADSFNIDAPYIHRVLAIPAQAAILIRTTIVIHESQHKVAMEPYSLAPLLCHRWKQLCFRAFPILVKQVVREQSPALNEAIKASWAAYEPVGQWYELKPPHEHWLNSQSASDGPDNTLAVQFNMLTGELLVNGMPLNKLPNDYEQNSTYEILFGKLAIDALPSSAKGMKFSGKQKFEGYTLHFNLSTEKNILPETCLIVQATSQDATFELIPPYLLREKIPFTFVDNFVHWYNATEDYVEFRPRERAWIHSTENWRLCRAGEGKPWRLSKGEKSLVNNQSLTATRFSNIFQPLEDAPYIHVTFHHNTSMVQIDLPRLQLRFFSSLEEALIKSHQHRGMAVHENQSMGTLVGLKSKLVLRSIKASSRDKVIIPNGKISYGVGNDHIRVMVDRSSPTKTQTYEVDRQLGRIIDNGTLTNKLFLAYLHGLTSFCLPDPLTGLTGTNAALTIIRSAAVRSFPSVSQEEINLLVDIAHLTPMREYYPDHLQEMETIHWKPTLSFLAQHTEYYEAVESLFGHFKLSGMFHPENSVKIPTLPKIHETLLRREKIRSAALRVWDFGAQHYTQMHDKVYISRDCSQHSQKAVNALSLSAMTFRGGTNPHVPMAMDIGRHLWEFLRTNCRVLDSITPSSPENFGYDAALLVEPSQILAGEFMARLRALRSDESPIDRYRVMMWLATLAFAEVSDMTILQTLALFFNCHSIRSIQMPEASNFDLSYGSQLADAVVKDKVLASTHDFADTKDANLERYAYERDQDFFERRSGSFRNHRDRTVSRFVKGIMDQWPCENLQLPPHVESYPWEDYINVDAAMLSLESRLQTLYDNHCLGEYLDNIGKAVPHALGTFKAPVYMPMPTKTIRSRARGFVTSDDLFSGPAPNQVAGIELEIPDFKTDTESRRDVSLLPSLLLRLDAMTGSEFEANYMMGLRDSSSALSGITQSYDAELDVDKLHTLFVKHRTEWDHTVNKRYSSIRDAVTKLMHMRLCSGNGMATLHLSLQHFPQPSPMFLLERLSRGKWRKLSNEWKRCLIEYGLALTQLQRADRLLDMVEIPASLMKELKNSGHENWDPFVYPESLLLEIESGILIRNIQEQIAGQMRSPPLNKNAVMQLNMGEGKSSVIVPIVAASLADTTRLVRVVVAKPQSKQMLQMLIAKLGGLLNRQIYHLPFSRTIKLDDHNTQAIVQLLQECMKSGGILLTQPENILSFMLMGIESRISGKIETSQVLTKTLRRLDNYTRDIVDESDENFSVKFEVLYTLGLQRPIQYSPERWICIQHVLEIFRNIVLEVQQDYPLAIEIHPRPTGGFPRTRVLQTDAQYRILLRIAEEVCNKGLRGFPIAWQPEEFRNCVFSYITQPQPSPAVISIVEDNSSSGFWARSRDVLLLLRGLLAGGVLSFCFGQKRWRVDYGLDPSRKPATKLALPFRAKDSPTPRSEFSHPEVVIVLTQLSYYYGGLGQEELYSAFKYLMKEEQADVEFQAWIRGAKALPDEFKQLSGINLEDRSTCEAEIFPHFRFSQGAINYFLSKIVFPKEMKEFPSKISASGWDIGKSKAHPTTGFSGTNDSRAFLPLSVKQLDLPEQKHTNALVLEHLLQPENSVALMPPHAGEDISDAKMLLDMVIRMDPPVRVILDVGAQILELDNVGVAREWLFSTQDHKTTEAVVFFNEDDELSVLNRKGRIESLQVSPYINQLDLCLVFLDEAHTRGTELKLPRNYRAAVTLGANLTKDRLVQACMRMRLLGQGQSIIFCVPHEIHLKIKRFLPDLQPTSDPSISVSDVLMWAITETWKDAQRNIQLWAAQGRRHERHKKLWDKCHAEKSVLTEQLAKEFLEDEAKSLEERYQPLRNHDDAQLDDAIGRRCQQFSNFKLIAPALQEEQERELAPEIEHEQQIERPPLAEPEQHSLHEDVIRFIKTGQLVEGAGGYMSAFKSLQGTSAEFLFDVSKFGSGLLVSADFTRTVKTMDPADKLDRYQRLVQWVLTASQIPRGAAVHMMIISSYEANELLPEIQKSAYAALHVYGPRPNLGYRSLDKLNLYTIPEALKDREIPRRFITELNLFAGQLYISSYDEYVEICKFLGLAWEPAKDGEIIGADGFIYKDHAGRVGGESGFQASPVEFFKFLFTKIRRDCETIDKTHMGQILDNRLFSAKDFD